MDDCFCSHHCELHPPDVRNAVQSLGMSEKLWVLPEMVPADFTKKHPDLHPVVLQLLYHRGLRDRGEIERFLSPNYERDVHSPEMFSQMQKAVERVFQALERGEPIRIHGDYDADGICGASVLYTALRDIIRAWPNDSAPDESLVSVFLPDRERDGYGFALPTAEAFAAEGVKLIITVDCGISNKASIDRACELGLDTIVCDHHVLPDELPSSAILLHPLVPGETYPNKHLCGTGVASKLAWGLLDEARKRGFKVPEGCEKWLLDLVAIATVTDVMPLLGENRALETYGLTVLNKTRRPGLKRLIEISGANKTSVDTWNIGFQIGPRINAAGRMTHARHAFETLVEEDDIVSAMLAANLDGTNRDRQRESDALYARAKAMVSGQGKLIVVWGDGWPLGLVGLVAGKLVSDFGRPVFAAARHGDRFVGSGRSVPGFDMTRPLHAAREHLLKFGGHPQACGFTAMGEDQFHKAMEIASIMAEETLSNDVLTSRLSADVEIELRDIDEALVERIKALAPFGEKNPQPLFVSRRVRVVRAAPVGKEHQHLKLALSDEEGDRTLDAIGFGYGNLLEEISAGDRIDVVYELGINIWNGYRSVQLRLVDVKL